MSGVSLLVICHDNVGAAIVEAAQRTLGRCPLPVQVLCATSDCDPDELFASGLKAIAGLDQGAGVLILTDMFGSTPSNIATRFLSHERVRVVAGINLPMMIRILNYAQLPLDELVAKAVAGGRDSVFQVSYTS
jgi:mannose PTS system EIIA component